MKNTKQHRRLADSLRNHYGYKVAGTPINKNTGEASILMTNAADAAEIYEIFGHEGYQIGHTTK